MRHRCLVLAILGAVALVEACGRVGFDAHHFADRDAAAMPDGAGDGDGPACGACSSADAPGQPPPDSPAPDPPDSSAPDAPDASDPPDVPDAPDVPDGAGEDAMCDPSDAGGTIPPPPCPCAVAPCP